MSAPTPEAVLSSLALHPHVTVLADRVAQAAFTAAAARNAGFLARSAQADAASGPPSDLLPEHTQTELGDVRDILRRGVREPEHARLVSALLAIGLRQDRSLCLDAPKPGATALLWLAAYTPADALPYLDAALGEEAGPLWRALASLLKSPSSAQPSPPPCELLVAAAALRGSSSSAAAESVVGLRQEVTDPLLGALLNAPDTSASAVSNGDLHGELSPPPQPAWRLTLLALTGILFVAHLVRATGRLALGYRRPAALHVGASGLRLQYRTELLGRVLTDRELMIPPANLARVTREVRFARAGLYVGLFTLALGTYLGAGFLVDGVRVPGTSPPLLALGVLIILAGLVIDFGLSTLSGSLRGKCRVVVTPVKGKPMCVGALSVRDADDMLLAFAQTVGATESEGTARAPRARSGARAPEVSSRAPAAKPEPRSDAAATNPAPAELKPPAEPPVPAGSTVSADPASTDLVSAVEPEAVPGPDEVKAEPAD